MHESTSRRSFLRSAAALGAAGLGAVSATQAQDQANQDAADVIYLNGKVYTVNEDQKWAEAFAVKDGKFVKVGTNAEVQRLRGEKTEVVDLRGHLVLPGLIDDHMHPDCAADNYFNVNVDPEATTFEEFKKLVRDFLKKNPDEFTSLMNNETQRISDHAIIYPGDNKRTFKKSKKSIDLSKIMVSDVDGQPLPLDILLRDRMLNSTMVVLKDGKIVHEHYWSGTNKDTKRFTQSAGKSFTSSQQFLQFKLLLSKKRCQSHERFEKQRLCLAILGLTLLSINISAQPLSGALSKVVALSCT